MLTKDEMKPKARLLSEGLESLSQTQQERLAFLELRAFFCGELKRADIENRFGIAPAAATRDLQAYRELNPLQLSYDSTQRRYIPSERFKPLFPFSTERILNWLLHGFGDGLDIQHKPIPCDGVTPLISPDLSVLSSVTRAIHTKSPLKLTYLSLSSGKTERTIVPGALADNGTRWHLRAYDRERKRFADFVLTRIIKAAPLAETPLDHEQLLADQQWLRLVDLELVPHPALAHPEAIARDYAMASGVLQLQIRAALAGYALNRWNVDCSNNHSLDSKQHQLWLRNTESLYGVDSASLAPGYRKLNKG